MTINVARDICDFTLAGYYTYMISRTHRFHGYNALSGVYRNGRTVRTTFMTLKYAANPRRTEYRLAVVVSRKVSKSAVVRNRIRRRIFEAYRLQSAQFVTQPDMVVTVFSDQIMALSHAELTKAVGNQLHQAGVVKQAT